MFFHRKRVIILSLVLMGFIFLLNVANGFYINIGLANLNANIDINCNGDFISLSLWLYEAPKNDVEVGVISPYGVHFYKTNLQPTDANSSKVFWAHDNIGRCLPGIYRVEIYDNKLYGYKVFQVIDNQIRLLSSEHASYGDIYIVGRWVNVKDFISFDVFFRNSHTATVAISRKDVELNVLLFWRKYLLYSSVYDKEGKLIKYSIREGRRVIVSPNQTKKIAVISLPVPEIKRLYTQRKLRQEMMDFYVFTYSSLINPVYIHVPIYKASVTSTVPQWSERYIYHFSNLFGLPFENLVDEATRGDMAILLMTMTASTSTFTAASFPVFRDVPVIFPYYSILLNLKEANIIGGYPDGTYRPEQTLSRLESAIFILKYLYGEHVYDMVKSVKVRGIFKDVPKNSWYAPWVELAYAKGLIKGYEDGTFRPFAAITRLETVVLLDRVYLLYGK